MPIAQGARQFGAMRLQSSVSVVDDHKIVAATMHAGEPQRAQMGDGS
jgi:hypothetical protein